MTAVRLCLALQDASDLLHDWVARQPGQHRHQGARYGGWWCWLPAAVPVAVLTLP